MYSELGNAMKLSVLMSVYHKESPAFLSECLDSLALQTFLPDEVVIVEDGPLGEGLEKTIGAYRKRLPIVSLRLPVNVGLGAALRKGLGKCRGEYVARMDSDDICLPDRFRQQMDYLERNPQIAVVGSAIAEFDENCAKPHSIRRLPETGPDLLHFAQFRNPMNHMTVMFKKASVQAAGSYQHCPSFEDYYLWARMIILGYRLHNIDEIFVYVRCGKRMQARRGGLGYLKQDIAFQLILYRIGLISASVCIRNILVRAPSRLTPRFLRAQCYKLFLRKRFVPGMSRPDVGNVSQELTATAQSWKMIASGRNDS